MDKDDLRARMMLVDPVDQGRVDAVVEGLFTWLSPRLPGTIAGYLAMGHEIEVSPLFDRLPGWRWVLPRVESDLSLTLRDLGVVRELHRWGMQQPIDSGEVVPVHLLDVILVPGLAFDRSGARLGRGGGYYDRLLGERRPDCVSVGVTPRSRIITGLPHEGHDIRVDYLATEDGVIRCSPPSF